LPAPRHRASRKRRGEALDDDEFVGIAESRATSVDVRRLRSGARARIAEAAFDAIARDFERRERSLAEIRDRVGRADAEVVADHERW